jgi:3-oxo-4-pregnene-20-carboxyl-CoA dehydrogenase alpha subunit
MIVELCSEAKEFGQQALRAFETAGGDDLVRRAESNPAARAVLTARVLAELGAWDLEPRSDADSLEAAAALCRSAGYWALPYPVAERLSRPSDAAADGLVVVSKTRKAAAISGIDIDWAAVTLDGQRSVVSGLGNAEPAFVAQLDLTPLDAAGRGDVALALVLPCWTLLGMLDRALALTVAHVQSRHQFGQPLAGFQSVQFQLTDGEVERAGLEMLAKYALWSVGTGRPEAVDDALALRMAALEAADVVFRVCHQLHGAVGFCDETTLSWLSRYSQPLRRLPFGVSATRDVLTRRIDRRGLTGLFSPEPATTS